MAFKRPSVQFCPAPPEILKTPDHHLDGRGFCALIVLGGSLLQTLKPSHRQHILTLQPSGNLQACKKYDRNQFFA